MAQKKRNRIQTPEDVSRILGISMEAIFLPLHINEAYQRSRASNLYALDDIRFACKLCGDPFYRELFLNGYSIDQIEDAGFFDDGLAPGELLDVADSRWLTTQLDKIQKRIKDTPVTSSKKPLILLTTGAFAPIHEGHLEIMESAYKELSRLGFHVIGGYISPAHDDYVATKGAMAETWKADLRLSSIHQVLTRYDWLDVDPWMCSYAQTDLNFTDVIIRMESYIAKHVKSERKIEVAYVFGSDHASHARTFLKRGIGVCVSNRQGFEQIISSMETELAIARDRIFFVRQPNKKYSSRYVREGKQPPLNGLLGIKMQNTASETSTQPISYLIRDDLDWAISTWEPRCNRDILQKAKTDFYEGLEKALQSAFSQSSLVNILKDINVTFLPWQSRDEEWLHKFKRTISSTHKEILDSKDFLLGSRMSGLILKHPDGSVGSLPCVLPYASPARYAHLPQDQEMNFSRKVIDLNISFHEMIGKNLLLSDADLHFRNLMKAADFSDGMTMVEVLRKHHEMLLYSVKK